MKVAVYEGVRSITFQDRPDLSAAPGEVIVKIKYCGICGTDLHIYYEGLLPPPMVLGHENVGTIADIGQGVEGWNVGERVAIGPPGPCGNCYYCNHGYPSLCETGFVRTNGLGPGHDGGMAEYMKVQDPKGMLHKIPDEVSFEDAVLIDTITVGLRGIIQSRFKIGDNVVVSGAGPIGLGTIQWLKIAGARHITALEPSEKKRQLALKLGADEVLNPLEEGENLRDKVLDRYGGLGADIAFECAGIPPAFETALDLIRGAGQLLVLGHSENLVSINDSRMVLRESNIKASNAYSGEEVVICLDFLARGRFDTKGFLEDIISLDDILEKGFERLKTDQDLMKIAVAP